MKKLLGFAIVFSLISGVAGAATIVGTKHDMNSGAATYKGGNNAQSQVCIYCHTPHNALSTLIPLWNHATTLTAAFILYPTGGTMNGVPVQPLGASKACLSCHDGTVNVDAFAANVGATKIAIGNPANFGTDLSNDHPISFNYNAALVTADTATAGGVVGLVVPTSTSMVVAGIPLFGGTGSLECASCHAVHDGAIPPFLRSTNTSSLLCLKCHIK